LIADWKNKKNKQQSAIKKSENKRARLSVGAPYVSTRIICHACEDRHPVFGFLLAQE